MCPHDDHMKKPNSVQVLKDAFATVWLQKLQIINRMCVGLVSETLCKHHQSEIEYRCRSSLVLIVSIFGGGRKFDWVLGRSRTVVAY